MVTDIRSQVLYEDNHLIIINKLPSQIVQGDKTGDIPLSELLKLYLKEKYSKPGEVFLEVVHRLDRPVSGVTVFARTSKALSRLNEMLKKRELHKTYWAVVKNRPPEPEGTLIHFLNRDEARNKTFVVHEGTRSAQRAELSYKIIGASHSFYLLEIELITGRHHQIRCQLSAMGCPIRGDLKYGFPRSNPQGAINLHARKVEFIHPVTKNYLTVLADPPSDQVWNLFKIV